MRNLLLCPLKRHWYKKNDIIAKSSEENISVKTECVESLEFYEFLAATSGKLSATLISFPSLDADRKEHEVFKSEFAYP